MANPSNTNPVKIFIAYSRLDEAYLKTLKKHLNPLQRNGSIEIWYDGEIVPGSNWEQKIKEHLHTADIILLLVSANSLDCDAFNDRDMAAALARHEKGEAIVVPIILSHCTWEFTHLRTLQALPQGDKPISEWDDASEAYTSIVRELNKGVEFFRIGKYEVTQAQWEAIMDKKPNSKFASCHQCPVEQISWNDTQDFLKKLNQRTGRKFRLPTEAEWEFAARGGVKSKGGHYAGSDSLGMVAWHKSNSDRKTHIIGQKEANELGLYDMTGNVWEWCNDWYASKYSTNGFSKNPQGPTSGKLRVARGGSAGGEFSNGNLPYRLTARINVMPHYTTSVGLIGFRIAE